VSYIAICHNPEEWLPSLSSDARRRVRDHVEFRAYSVDQLADILEDRARLGLVEDAVERTTLERIGRHVDGKARNAIQALKAASDIAVEDHRDHIKDVDVSAAVSRARAVVRSSNLRSLPSQHLLLYGLIQRAESILAEDLNREYDAVAEDVFDGDKEVPRSTETRRRYLRKLEAYDLIGSHGENRGTTYFAQDPELAVPEDADMEIPDVVEQ
jgi:cell division control protein 6